MIKRLIVYTLGVTLALLAACSNGSNNPTGGNGGTEPTNSPMSVSTDGIPNSYQLPNVPEHSFSVSDEDAFSDFQAAYFENGKQIWQRTGVTGTSWDTTWTPDPAPGTARFEFSATDNFSGDKETENRNKDITISAAGDEPGSAGLSAPSSVVNGDALNMSFDVNDADGIDSVYVFSDRGAQADTTLEFKVSGTSASQNFTLPYNLSESALPQSFTHQATLVDADGNRYQSTEQTTQITAPADQAGTITLSVPATLTNGDVLSVTFDASDMDGIDSVYVFSDRGGQADTTIKRAFSSTGVNQSLEIPYNRPNSALPEDFTSQATLIDENGNRYNSTQETTTLEEAVNNETWVVSGTVQNANAGYAVQAADATLSQNGTEVDSDQTDSNGAFSMSVTQENAQTYPAALEKLGYQRLEQTINVNSDVDLGVLQLMPQEVLFTGFLDEQTREDSFATVTAQELDNITDFQDAGEDTIYVTTNDANLEVRVNGTSFELDPVDGFTGTASYTITAISQTDGRADQNESLQVTSAPKATILVANNETDQVLDNMNVPDALEAQLGVYAPDGTRTDTLSTTDGRFSDITLPGTSYAIIKTRFTRNGQDISYVRRDSIPHNASDVSSFETRVVDWYVRDINGNVVDELTPGAAGAASPEGFRRWAYGIHSGGVLPWNNNSLTPRPKAGYFHWFTDSAHPRGPDEVLLPTKIYEKQQDFTSIMYPDPRQYSKEIYNNHIRPWVDNELPVITEVDSIGIDYENNAYKNKAMIRPETNIPSGTVGTVLVFGESPQNVYYAEAGIRSKEGEDILADKYRLAASQEQTAGFGFFSRAAADDFGVLSTQSVTHDVPEVIYPTNLDGKLMKTVWETTYTGKLENVFGPNNY